MVQARAGRRRRVYGQSLAWFRGPESCVFTHVSCTSIAHLRRHDPGPTAPCRPCDRARPVTACFAKVRPLCRVKPRLPARQIMATSLVLRPVPRDHQTMAGVADHSREPVGLGWYDPAKRGSAPRRVHRAGNSTTSWSRSPPGAGDHTCLWPLGTKRCVLLHVCKIL